MKNFQNFKKQELEISNPKELSAITGGAWQQSTADWFRRKGGADLWNFKDKEGTDLLETTLGPREIGNIGTIMARNAVYQGAEYYGFYRAGWNDAAESIGRLDLKFV